MTKATCCSPGHRASTSAVESRSLRLYSGTQITVPALFIAGSRDWGIHQTPGALQAMADRVCTDFRGLQLLPGAGHWVQQERAEAVAERLIAFFGL